MQIFGGIVGIAFGYYGMFGRVPAHTPIPQEVAVLAAFYFLLCVGVIIAGCINLFSKSGIPTEEIVTEDEEEATGTPDKPDVEARLRRLVRLHEDHLITDEEFERKRAEILNEKW